MTIGHKAGHYCHFGAIRGVNSDTGRKKKERKKKKKKNKRKNKSFGIYWEGDDTFDLKVPFKSSAHYTLF